MRIFGSFFAGFLFVLAVVFNIFVGLKINYFENFKINEYFNAIFIDNLNFYALMGFGVVVGYLLLYAKFRKIFRIFYLLALIISALTWQKDVGLWLGFEIFSQKSKMIVGYKDKVAVWAEGVILYQGREFLYFLKDDGVVLKRQKTGI